MDDESGESLNVSHVYGETGMRLTEEREGLFSTIQKYSCENGQHQNTKWRVAKKA